MCDHLYYNNVLQLLLVLIAPFRAVSIMVGFVPTGVVTLRLPEDLENILRQKAVENNTTITYVIIDCLRKRLDVE